MYISYGEAQENLAVLFFTQLGSKVGKKLLGLLWRRLQKMALNVVNYDR